MSLYIIIGITIALAFYIITKRNGIIKLRNKRTQSFADIDVQLKQRFDLVPQLLETVKGYASHEKDLLENVTNARTSFMDAKSVDEKVNANNMLSSTLKSLFAVSENYPDLKANQNFLSFQNELSDIENKLAASRRFFNNTTTEYNTFTQMFPTSVIAEIFHHPELPLFELETDEKTSVREVPNITFTK